MCVDLGVERGSVVGPSDVGSALVGRVTRAHIITSHYSIFLFLFVARCITIRGGVFLSEEGRKGGTRREGRRKGKKKWSKDVCRGKTQKVEDPNFLYYYCVCSITYPLTPFILTSPYPNLIPYYLPSFISSHLILILNLYICVNVLYLQAHPILFLLCYSSPIYIYSTAFDYYPFVCVCV